MARCRSLNDLQQALEARAAGANRATLLRARDRQDREAT